jgi:hypothetical protein
MLSIFFCAASEFLRRATCTQVRDATLHWSSFGAAVLGVQTKLAIHNNHFDADFWNLHENIYCSRSAPKFEDRTYQLIRLGLGTKSHGTL